MGDIKRQRVERRAEFISHPLAKALGMYLIELARETGTDRFHCSHVLPANPFYRPEHLGSVEKKWSQFAYGEDVAALYPGEIVYGNNDGWFTVTPLPL